MRRRFIARSATARGWLQTVTRFMMSSFQRAVWSKREPEQPHMSFMIRTADFAQGIIIRKIITFHFRSELLVC